MDKKVFLKTYYNNFKQLINFEEETILKIVQTSELLLDSKKKGKKNLIFGNGGSAAIASHFSVDLTKNAKVRCTNYNESDLITCFSNDFGYEKWIEKTIDFYGEKGDVLVVISSSGNSKNIINGCKSAKKRKFKSIITLSGFYGKNKLYKLGNVNFAVNSKSYNLIENTHQILLLSLVDLIIGKSIYPVN